MTDRCVQMPPGDDLRVLRERIVRVEAALARSESRFDSLFEDREQPIAILDRDGESNE